MQKTIYNPAYRRLVNELRRLRLERGLRQADVGHQLGVSRHWIAKIERGETRLDIVQLVRLCRLYGADTGRFVRELEQELSDEDGSFLPIAAFFPKYASGYVRLGGRVDSGHGGRQYST